MSAPTLALTRPDETQWAAVCRAPDLWRKIDSSRPKIQVGRVGGSIASPLPHFNTLLSEPLVNVCRPTVATVLVLRGFPNASRQAAVVILERKVVFVLRVLRRAINVVSSPARRPPPAEVR